MILKIMNLKHFFADFHTGFINRTLHIIGILMFIFGAWQLNWLMMLISMFIPEIGHIYNHYSKRVDVSKIKIITILFWQTILSSPALITTFVIVRLVKKLLYGN